MLAVALNVDAYMVREIMYRNHLRYLTEITLVGFLLAFSGCERSKVVSSDFTIRLDVTDSEELQLNEGEGVILDESNFILGMIEDLIVSDSCIYVKSNNTLSCYDMDTGRFHRRYSRPGRGHGEYLKIWDFGVMDKEVFIYDIDSKKTLFFSCYGQYVRSIEHSKIAQDCPFQSLHPLFSDSLFIGKRVFGMPNTPELSFYDRQLHYLKPIGIGQLRSGIKLWRQFYNGSDSDVLYNKYFSNDIWSISKNSHRIKYHIVFNNRNLPSLEDEYDYVQLLANDNTSKEYCIIMGNFLESDSIFGFQFISKGNRYYAIFEKSSGQTRVFLPSSRNIEEVYQVFYDGENVYILGRLYNKRLALFKHIIGHSSY